MEVKLEKLLFNRKPLKEYGSVINFIPDTDPEKLRGLQSSLIQSESNIKNFSYLLNAVVNKSEIEASITNSGTEGEVVGVVISGSGEGMTALPYADVIKFMTANNLSSINNIEKGIAVTVKKTKARLKEADQKEYADDLKLSFTGVTLAYGNPELSDFVKEPTRIYSTRSVSSEIFFNITNSAGKTQKVTVSGKGSIPNFVYREQYEDIFNKVDMDDPDVLKADIEAMSKERGEIIKAFINDELPPEQKVVVAKMLKEEFGENPSGFTRDEQEKILKENGQDIMAGKYGEKMKEIYMKATNTPEGGKYMGNGLSVVGGADPESGVRALEISVVDEIIEKLQQVKAGVISVDKYLEPLNSDEVKVYPTKNPTKIALARFITRL